MTVETQTFDGTSKAIQTIETDSLKKHNDELAFFTVMDQSYAVEPIDYTHVPEVATIHTLATNEISPPIYQRPRDARPYIRVLVNGVESFPLLDTGAMVCVIGYTHEDELKEFNAEIEPCGIKVTTVNRSSQCADGLMHLKYEIGDKQQVLPTIILKTLKKQFIVGINFWRAFNIQMVWGDLAKHIPDAIRLCEEHKEKCDNEARTGSVTNETHATAKIQQATNAMRSTMIKRNSQPVTTGVKTSSSCRPMAVPSNEHLEQINVAMIKKEPQSTAKTIRYVEPESLLQQWWETGTNCRVTIPTDLASTYEAAPTDLILGLLNGTDRLHHKFRNRKTHWSVEEYDLSEISATVKTADDALDTERDVVPEKHSCVSTPHDLTKSEQKQLTQVLTEFPYTTDSGQLNVTQTHIQHLNTGDAAPVMRKQYPLSPYIMAEVKKEIDKLIERDIIVPIDFSPWRWPILWVKKKTGGGRICVDARGLNQITVPDAYPTLNVDTILRNLPRAKYISCLDMTQAFHQIEIAEKDRLKTSFAVGHQFYCYKRAIMGFKNSPADLAKMLDKIFGDMMPKVYHYVDDFIILSETFDEYIQLLREVARRLRISNLTISQKKSSFCHKRLTFLGYLLTEEGLTANPERVQPILEYKRPLTVKELRRLVGLITWYRRFIPNAAEILAPLTDMAKGDNKWSIQWTDEAEQAFEKAKEALISPAILAAPDYSLPYIIYTDASLIAGSAVLTQIQNGVEKVIAFHSVKFSRTQRNYSATERECLAVLSGVEKFRPYIDGVSFTVVTDHASLTWLQNLKEPHGKLARWAVRLQAFDIKFVHRPGKLMTVPDALSRAIELIDVHNLDSTTSDVWYKKKKELATSGSTQQFKVENGLLYKKGKYNTTSGDRL